MSVPTFPALPQLDRCLKLTRNLLGREHRPAAVIFAGLVGAKDFPEPVLRELFGGFIARARELDAANPKPGVDEGLDAAILLLRLALDRGGRMAAEVASYAAMGGGDRFAIERWIRTEPSAPAERIPPKTARRRAKRAALALTSHASPEIP